MQKVLITGGAGFIGSNFVRFLLDREPLVKVYNLDALTYAGSQENFRDLSEAERYTFIEGDICDRSLVDQLLRKDDIDTIVHFAAETHVDRSILGPAQFVQTNIVGTFTLLEAARQYWLSQKNNSDVSDWDSVRFHHVSTDEVYGTLAPGEPAFAESNPYAPNSPYAASKASSDHLVRSYYHTYGMPVTISNCSNNYGPYQFPEKLIPVVILNALEGNFLPVYGDGQQIRDWLYVEDHCEAIWTVLRKGKPGETYNVGGNNQPPNLEIIQLICGILDERKPDSPFRPHETLIRFVADRPGHDRRYAMNISKIYQELGWQPRQSLESGLRQTVQWYLDHPDWIDKIRKKQDYQRWMDQNYAKRGESA
jgi:dTDP-glucose 4,6-dehydratase